jgi:hypothetical protein
VGYDVISIVLFCDLVIKKNIYNHLYKKNQSNPDTSVLQAPIYVFLSSLCRCGM